MFGRCSNRCPVLEGRKTWDNLLEVMQCEFQRFFRSLTSGPSHPELFRYEQSQKFSTLLNSHPETTIHGASIKESASGWAATSCWERLISQSDSTQFISQFLTRRSKIYFAFRSDVWGLFRRRVRVYVSRGSAVAELEPKSRSGREIMVPLSVLFPSRAATLPVMPIGNRAFCDVPSTSMTIPRLTQILCSKCFSQSTSLSSISFETNSELTNIESQTFSDCFSLKSITIPRYVQILCFGRFMAYTSLSSISFWNRIRVATNRSYCLLWYRAWYWTGVTSPIRAITQVNIPFCRVHSAYSLPPSWHSCNRRTQAWKTVCKKPAESLTEVPPHPSKGHQWYQNVALWTLVSVHRQGLVTKQLFIPEKLSFYMKVIFFWNMILFQKVYHMMEREYLSR
jgi:hypothetical protein